jgi:hypothetical protein
MSRRGDHGKDDSEFVAELRAENRLDSPEIGLPLLAQNQRQRSKINLALLS